MKELKLVGALLSVFLIFGCGLNVFARDKEIKKAESSVNQLEKSEVFGNLRCSFRESKEMKKFKDNTEKLMVIYTKIKEALEYTLKEESNKISKKDYDLILYYISHQFCLPDNEEDKNISYGLYHNNNGCLFFNLSKEGYEFFNKVLSNLNKVEITEEIFKQSKNEIVRVIAEEIRKGRKYTEKVKTKKRKKECENIIKQLEKNIKKIKNVKYETFKMVEKNYIRPKDLEEKTNTKEEKYKGGVNYN